LKCCHYIFFSKLKPNEDGKSEFENFCVRSPLTSEVAQFSQRDLLGLHTGHPIGANQGIQWGYGSQAMDSVLQNSLQASPRPDHARGLM
jgi:hypothetical protein